MKTINQDIEKSNSFNQQALANLRQSNNEKAVEYFKKACQVYDKNYIAYTNLGKALLELGLYDEALKAMNMALKISPGNPHALDNKGTLFIRMKKFKEAEKAYLEMAKKDPGNPDHWIKVATVLCLMFQFEKAKDLFALCIQKHPNHLPSRIHFGLFHLLQGDLRRGFSEIEYRTKIDDAYAAWQKKAKTPLWQGEAIAQKTLLVREEEGIGDIIQFLRYLPLLEKYRCKVIVYLHSSLHLLFSSLNVSFAASEGPIPEHDLHINLLSLPQIFQTEIATIPPPTLIRGIDLQPIKNRIGILWKGNPKHTGNWSRSLGLKLFKPFFELPNLHFISLQKEITEEERCFLNTFQIQQGNLSTWLDTAKEIARCEKVISVDSSVAHLAATIGVPTYLLISRYPDWRWMLNRNDSPWYPNTRLFRQTDFENWIDPIRVLLSKLLDPSIAT